MSTNKTPNYQLSQWLATDPIRMSDFNADNQIIDAALKAEADTRAEAIQSLIITGTYTGTATGSNLSQKQTVELGFQPRFLFVRDASYKGSNQVSDNWTPQNVGFATPEYGQYVYSTTQVLKITDTGFTAGGVNGIFNASGTVYTYLAIR